MGLNTALSGAVSCLSLPRHKRKLAMTLAGCALVGLLIVFVQVLLGAVAQGDLRRRNDAAVADATWRCQALRGVAARVACLASLRSQAGAH